MVQYEILVMPGEGIGPEIVEQGVAVLQQVQRRFNLSLTLTHFDVGQAAYERTGHYLPLQAKQACDRLQHSDRGAILFGAVTGEPIGMLRKDYDLFANLRPVQAFAALADISPLKASAYQALNMLIVRELTSGIYYGAMDQGEDDAGQWASQTMYYHEQEVRRIAKVALQAAQGRRQHLTLVHKGNVIEGVFDLWRRVLAQEAKAFAQVCCDDVLVDNMAMQMLLNPGEYDVLLCSNLFGDILSDQGAGLVGSIGVMPSMSRNPHGFALYESIGGTAPTLAGQNKANPISTILSVALLCRYTLDSEAAAQWIEQAVQQVLSRYRTADIAHPRCETLSTGQMGQCIIDQMQASRSTL